MRSVFGGVDYSDRKSPDGGGVSETPRSETARRRRVRLGLPSKTYYDPASTEGQEQ